MIRRLVLIPAATRDDCSKSYRDKLRLPVRVHVVPLVALFYALVLGCLLLVSNPYVLLVAEPMRSAYRLFEPAMHFICFAGLGCLTMLGQAPLARRYIWSGLILLAVASEVLQGLVPARTPELGDLVQNLLGLAAGAGGAGVLLWIASPVPPQMFALARGGLYRWLRTLDKAFLAKRPSY